MKYAKKQRKESPLVSVIMPVYNAAAYLPCAIESILSQTYQTFELWIVDDVSTDGSWSIIQSYQRRFPTKIHAVRLKKNTNAAGNGAVNAVLPRAKGAYIARMDADDVAHPDRLKKQVAFLNTRSDVIVVGSQARVINAEGEVVGKKTYPCDHDSIYRMYPIVHPIVHPSCMIRRSLLPDRNKLYALRYGVNDDYYTFFSLHQYGKFANLPQMLLDYRIHGANSSLQNLKEKYATTSKIRMAARREFGYTFSLRVWIIITLQTAIVSVIPEKMLISGYLWIRGINNHPLRFTVGKLKHYALSFI